VLALAALVLLAIDPFLLHSVGFLLSCGASLGITLLAAPIARRLRGPMWACEVLAVTAAAQVGVAPILIPVFGSMPLVSLPANLVAVPLAAPLTIWGLATGVVGGIVHPIAPQVTSLLGVPTTALLHGLRAIAALASRVPVAIDGRGACATAALGCLLAATMYARNLRRDERSSEDPVPAR
jgi:competence protein ComEC